MKTWQLALIGAAVLSAGCSELGGMATRYRVEKMERQVRREEIRLRTGADRPDSATLLKIAANYSRLRATFKPPYVRGSGESARRLNGQIARSVGMAELSAARFALQARRPDLALEHARWVASIAGADTGLHREADFVAVAAQRRQGNREEAIALLRGMLERYQLIPPPSYEKEDRLLGVPDQIVEIYSDMGDSSGVRRERSRAIEYFTGELRRAPPPILEAQVRGRLARLMIEAGRTSEAFVQVEGLKRLIAATESLRDLEPEVLYSEARIRQLVGQREAALDLFDLVLMAFPKSAYAQRALFDSGVLLEQMRNWKEAVARYRAAYGSPNPDPIVAPVANFRAAMVMEQAGNWGEANRLLEGIPVRFPRSRAAIEAPFAVVEHYVRMRDQEGVRSALDRAVRTYRQMIAQDSTSAIATACRWNIVRAYAALKKWKDALATVDEMGVRDPHTRATAEAFVEGARIAASLGDMERSNMYLRRLMLDFPGTPFAKSAQQVLAERTGSPGGAGAKTR